VLDFIANYIRLVEARSTTSLPTVAVQIIWQCVTFAEITDNEYVKEMKPSQKRLLDY